ncbi:hypothetical protein HU200_043964 [Digitaria exilis]|uniref:DUF6598 domain-containing protein n=1 Tax=Digitaria exilis TaxID=1010633 RepID=A0A835BDW6_9POAL|nr:hypothetical protein HU200_043964 [Digitaria exilis]
MLLSDPKDCKFYHGTCFTHQSRNMLQIFSLKLAKIPVDTGSVELYGYIATRDVLDPLLNYVVNFSRNDPLIVKKGSLIEMTGPKRGIELCDSTLIEYDMRIKTGGQAKSDLQLIDGVSFVDERGTLSEYAITRRIHGDYGAVDITISRLDHAFEATVEVVIPEVQGSFNMSLGCFTSKLDKEIQLFDGTIVEPRGLGWSVVAVVMRTQMHLKFKIGSEPSSSSEYCCSFMPHCHGHATELVKTDFASISVKVTWSSLPCRWTTLHTLLERYAHDK